MKEELETILKNISTAFITIGAAGAIATSVIGIYYSEKKDKKYYSEKH